MSRVRLGHVGGRGVRLHGVDDEPADVGPPLAPTVDPLAALLGKLRPLGPWVTDAACARLGLDASTVFVLDQPSDEDRAMAESVCRRCPVRSECASYAAEGNVWGIWAGVLHGKRGKWVRKVA